MEMSPVSNEGYVWRKIAFQTSPNKHETAMKFAKMDEEIEGKKLEIERKKMDNDFEIQKLRLANEKLKLQIENRKWANERKTRQNKDNNDK